MNDLEKRCKTICEKGAHRCFTPGGNRFECLSDMLTDKMRAVREVIEIGIERNACPQVAGILDVASENIDEVLEWLTYLHSMRDCVMRENYRVQ
jgi:hypothetical protein